MLRPGNQLGLVWPLLPAAGSTGPASAADDPRVSPIVRQQTTPTSPPALVLARRRGSAPRRRALSYAEVLRRCWRTNSGLVTYPDAIHGFLSIPLFEPAAREALADIVTELGAA